MLPRHTALVVPCGNEYSTDDVRSSSITSLPDDDSCHSSGHSLLEHRLKREEEHNTGKQFSVASKADEELSEAQQRVAPRPQDSRSWWSTAGNAGSSPESGDSEADTDNFLSSPTSDSEDVPQYILTNAPDRLHTLVPVRDPESVASLLLEWEHLPALVVPPIVPPLTQAGVVVTMPPSAKEVMGRSVVEESSPMQYDDACSETSYLQTVLAGQKIRDLTKDCALSMNTQDMSSGLRCCPTDASTDGRIAQVVNSCSSEKSPISLQSARWQENVEARFLRGNHLKGNCLTWSQPTKAQIKMFMEKNEIDVTFDEILKELHGRNKTSMTELKQKPKSAANLAEAIKELKIEKKPTNNFFITQQKPEKAEESNRKIEKELKLVNKNAHKQHTDNFKSKIKPNLKLKTNCSSVLNNTYFTSLPTPFMNQCKADLDKNAPKVKLTLMKAYEQKPRQLSAERCTTQNCETQLCPQNIFSQTCLPYGKMATEASHMEAEESHSFDTVSELLHFSLEYTPSLEFTASETELLPCSKSITPDLLLEASTGADLKKLGQNVGGASCRVTTLSSTEMTCSDTHSKILEKILKSAPGGWLTAQPTELPGKNVFNSPETFKRNEYLNGISRLSRQCHFMLQGFKKNFVQKAASKSEVEKINDKANDTITLDLVQEPASTSESEKIEEKKNGNIMVANRQNGAPENKVGNVLQKSNMADMPVDVENAKRARRLSVLHHIAAAVDKYKADFEHTANKNVENVKRFKKINAMKRKTASEKTCKNVSFKDVADKKIAGQSRCENITDRGHTLQEGKEMISVPGRLDLKHNVSRLQNGPSLPTPSEPAGSDHKQHGADHYKTIQLAVENLQSRLPNLGADLKKSLCNRNVHAVLAPKTPVKLGTSVVLGWTSSQARGENQKSRKNCKECSSFAFRGQESVVKLRYQSDPDNNNVDMPSFSTSPSDFEADEWTRDDDLVSTETDEDRIVELEMDYDLCKDHKSDVTAAAKYQYMCNTAKIDSTTGCTGSKKHTESRKQTDGFAIRNGTAANIAYTSKMLESKNAEEKSTKVEMLAGSAEHGQHKGNSVITMRRRPYRESSYLFETNACKSNKEWKDIQSAGDAEIDRICAESFEASAKLGNPKATSAGSLSMAADGTELAVDNIAASTRAADTDVPSQCSAARPKPSKDKSSTLKFPPTSDRGATKWDEEDVSPVRGSISLNNGGETKTASWGFASKPLRGSQTNKEGLKTLGSRSSDSEDSQSLAAEWQEQRCQSRGSYGHPRMETISKRQMQDIYRTMTDFEKRPKIVSSLRKAISEMSKSNYDRFSRAKNDYLS